MKRVLKGKIKRLELNRNHFEMYGFFETNSGKIYYVSTGDLRWFAKRLGMLIRTAKDFKDFTGGTNCTIMFDEHFEENLLKYATSNSSFFWGEEIAKNNKHKPDKTLERF